MWKDDTGVAGSVEGSQKEGQERVLDPWIPATNPTYNRRPPTPPGRTRKVSYLKETDSPGHHEGRPCTDIHSSRTESLEQGMGHDLGLEGVIYG